MAGIRVPLGRSGERPFREAWPFLLLLVAVLVPTGIVMWLMANSYSRAVASARQSVEEARRSHLRTLRPRVDDVWKATARRLSIDEAATAGKGPQALFVDLVRDQGIDGAVIFDRDGRIVFPTLVSNERLPSADQQLFALHMLPRQSDAGAERANALAAVLNDFTVPMPAGQRLFLMSEVKLVRQEIHFPLESALRLSIRAVESGIGRRAESGFSYGWVPHVWMVASDDQRVIGLYTTDRLKTLVEDTLAPYSTPGARLVAHPPGSVAPDVGIGAGGSLPGWMVSLAVDDDPTGAGADYTGLLVESWVVLVGIGLLGYLGVIAVQRLSRQMRVARLKTDLTAAVSHELRAPLASVQVLVDGLLADQELDPIKTREYLGLIAGEQTRLSRVIENFLSFARLERGEKRFNLVPTDPAQVVASAVFAVRDRVPPGGDIRLDLAGDLPQLMADPEALETALINLIDNAIKFTPDEKHIIVRAYADGPAVVLAVTDNGPGIPAGERRRIFRRFYRTDQRLARETAGVGLGLSIVALIVRGHGGEVEVSSEPDQGSTFALRLPAVTRPTA